MNNNINNIKIESIKNRIRILSQRETVPYNIINKLRRKLRKLEN